MKPRRRLCASAKVPAAGRRGAGGFTLIELSIVVGILGILVTLLAVSLREMSGSGQTAACQSNLRTIGVAIRNFALAHNGWLPGVALAEGDKDWQKSWMGNEAWAQAQNPGTLLPYLGGGQDVGKLYRCPGLTMIEPGTGTGSNDCFDYCGVSIMSGAQLHRVSPKAQMRDPSTGVWKEAWTPLVVEEDPAQSNNVYNPAPVYHGTDQMGFWHDKFTSNYYAASGSVHQVRFADAKGAQAAGDWKVTAPSGKETGIDMAGGENVPGGENVDFGWFNKQ